MTVLDGKHPLAASVAQIHQHRAGSLIHAHAGNGEGQDHGIRIAGFQNHRAGHYIDDQQYASIHGLNENIYQGALPGGVDFYKAVIKKSS